MADISSINELLRSTSICFNLASTSAFFVFSHEVIADSSFCDLFIHSFIYKVRKI